MYHLIIGDDEKVVRWDKTMKGIKLGGNQEGMFSLDKIDLYRNPVLNFCEVLQYGDEKEFTSMAEVRKEMLALDSRKGGGRVNNENLSVAIVFNQRIFKKDISRVMNDNFVMTIESEKRVRVTQSKRYPRPFREGDARALTFPIGWR